MSLDARAEAPTTSTHRVVLPIAGVPVDAITEQECIERIVSAALRGEGGLVVTPNVDHLHQIATGSWLASVYGEADLCLPDGVPLLWASRLMGDPLPERLAGADLLGVLCAAAAANSLSVFFLGGAPGAADAVAARFTAEWPELKVAGTACPPRGFERHRGGVDAVCDEVARAAPAIVFTALGAPKQDYLNLMMHRRMPEAWYLGVGAAFDMASGQVERAPEWAQRSGIEWLFRLMQEPRRMAGRYLVRDAPFAMRLLFSAWRQGGGRR